MKAILFVLAFLVVAAALCGAAASWVLAAFGVAVPWYVCAVAWFLLSQLLRMIGGSK